MKLLLHACCGPCACYPTEKLTADGIDFDIIFLIQIFILIRSLNAA